MMCGMWHDLSFQGPFDLTACARFAEGLMPGAVAEPGRLRLAFPVEPSWRPAGVLVQQAEPDGPVRARVFADKSDVDNVLTQTARILSLDVDGTAFPAVGARDPVVAELRRRYPGLRPVSFHSPYEAACWAVMSHRIRITQAASIRRQLAERFGTPVDVADVQVPTFPAPTALPERIPLVSQVKSDRLHGVAAAALDGRLEAEALRALPPEEALSRLRTLPGIGPFSAEPRLHDEMAHQYGLTDPTVADLTEVAEAWRPYRTWVALLLRARREEEIAEIANGRRMTRAS